MAKFTKIETNLPIIGIPRAAFFNDNSEKGWKDNINLLGSWGAGEDTYIGLSVDHVPALEQLGVVTVSTKDGKPDYRIKAPTRLRILRTEDGKKKITTITLANGSEAGTQPEVQPNPVVVTDEPVSDRSNVWKREERRIQMALHISKRAFAAAFPTRTGEEGWDDTDLREICTIARGVMVSADKQNWPVPE